MSKLLESGVLADEIVMVPASNYVYLEGPKDDVVVSPVPGILTRIIPCTEDGEIELWDGDPDSGGIPIVKTKLEHLGGMVDFNVRYNGSLHVIMDDDAKMTVIYDSEYGIES